MARWIIVPCTTVLLVRLDISLALAPVSPVRQPSTRFRPTLLRHAASNNNNNNNGDNSSFDDTCDVLVLGSGPAGRAIASLLSRARPKGNRPALDVLLADQNLDRSFPPNYGVWHDEWNTLVDRYSAAGVALEGGACGRAIDYEWAVTDGYFGGSFDRPMEDRLRVDRAYYRVDRDALRESFTSSSYRTVKANHISSAISPNVMVPAGTCVHDAEGTTVVLRPKNSSSSSVDDKKDDLTVRTRLIVDCTGHETKLVLRESARQPTPSAGYQIAYGILADVEMENGDASDSIGPYDPAAMALFDYRTDHYDDADEATRAKLVKEPTFMYAMPLGGNRVFFEETSLVALPAVSFQECKDRCYKRLKHHGIGVTKVHEEEFCYIPMGGALPAKDQRIVALGGAAAMVHPSTGFHLCRCLAGAADLADVIVDELAKSEVNLDRTAAQAYHALWSPSNIRQRNFSVYGGDFLMRQDVVGLRGFFSGFFQLPLPLWAGFLAGWPGLPNNEQHETWYARMWFGLNFVARLPPSVALAMFVDIVRYIVAVDVALAQSVTPFLGQPEGYEYKPNQDKLGDVARKTEARQMIQESKLAMDLPVDFEGDRELSKTSATIASEINENSAVSEALTQADTEESPATTSFQ